MPAVNIQVAQQGVGEMTTFIYARVLPLVSQRGDPLKAIPEAQAGRVALPGSNDPRARALQKRRYRKLGALAGPHTSSFARNCARPSAPEALCYSSYILKGPGEA